MFSRSKASKWVDTEMRAAIRKRVDETSFHRVLVTPVARFACKLADGDHLERQALGVPACRPLGAGAYDITIGKYRWAERLHESRDVDRGCRLTAAAFEIGDRNDHPCSVMTSRHDGGDRLSVQRGEVDWQGKRAT